jgi:hypothetical protein
MVRISEDESKLMITYQMTENRKVQPKRNGTTATVLAMT